MTKQTTIVVTGAERVNSNTFRTRQTLKGIFSEYRTEQKISNLVSASAQSNHDRSCSLHSMSRNVIQCLETCVPSEDSDQPAHPCR